MLLDASSRSPLLWKKSDNNSFHIFNTSVSVDSATQTMKLSDYIDGTESPFCFVSIFGLYIKSVFLFKRNIVKKNIKNGSFSLYSLSSFRTKDWYVYFYVMMAIATTQPTAIKWLTRKPKNLDWHTIDPGQENCIIARVIYHLHNASWSIPRGTTPRNHHYTDCHVEYSRILFWKLD